MGKIVDVTLRLIDKMSGPLKYAESALMNHSRQFIKAGKQIQTTGKQITGVGMSMTKAVTAPVAAAGGAAIKLAADFESGMSKVSSISGATGKDLDRLSNMAKKMGAKTKFSAKEATDAYQYMAMAGWKTGDMLNGIEPIMKLAGASGEDLATTSDIVTDALTAFGMKTKDTGKLTDIMAAASANANTNVAMLGESFKYCAPIAGAMGYNAKDVSVSLGLMANSGIKASQAGTAMRSWMSRMAKPTKEVEAAMSKLKLSITDSNGKMKPWNQIVQESRKAFSGLTAEQKASYAASIAGKSGMSGMLAVVNSSDKDFKKLTKAVNGSNGACKKMYDVANDNLNGSLTILKSTVEGIGISFGERLTPYVKKATKWIQSLADKFNSLNKKQQDTVIKVALVAAAVGPAVLIFGKMVTGIGKVVTAFGTLGKMFRTYGTIAGMLTSPSAIAVGAVAAVAVAALLIVKNWSKIKPVLLKVKEWFVTTFEKVKVSMQPAQKVCSQVIAQISKSIKSLKPTFDKMVKVVISNLPKMQKSAQKLFNAIKPILSQVIKLINKIASAVGEVLIYAFKKVTPIIKKFGEMFSTVFPIIVSMVQKHISRIIGRINKLRPAVTTVIGFISGAVDTFKKYIKSMIDSITKILGGIIDFITGVFTGNWKKAWEGLKSIVSGIFGGIVATVKRNINLVIDVVNGVIKGLNSIKIPKGIPGIGGKGINIPLIPKLAKGTSNWRGGIVQVHEKGGEIIDLPQGSRVYPHDKSVHQAYKDGQAAGRRKTVIQITKLADKIVVREDADIDKIVDKLAKKLEDTANNVGGGDFEYIY